MSWIRRGVCVRLNNPDPLITFSALAMITCSMSSPLCNTTYVVMRQQDHYPTRPMSGILHGEEPPDILHGEEPPRDLRSSPKSSPTRIQPNETPQPDRHSNPLLPATVYRHDRATSAAIAIPRGEEQDPLQHPPEPATIPIPYLQHHKPRKQCL